MAVKTLSLPHIILLLLLALQAFTTKNDHTLATSKTFLGQTLLPKAMYWPVGQYKNGAWGLWQTAAAK